jgi:hypothetical protein
MIGDVASIETPTAEVGTTRTDEPFPFASYVALASARDHLGPVTVVARHLPYGVWWDRLRPTIELVRPASDADGRDPAPNLPLDVVWRADGVCVTHDDPDYPTDAGAYRTGDGLF